MCQIYATIQSNVEHYCVHIFFDICSMIPLVFRGEHIAETTNHLKTGFVWTLVYKTPQHKREYAKKFAQTLITDRDTCMCIGIILVIWEPIR